MFGADESYAVLVWQLWAEQAQRGGAYCGLGRRVFLMVHVALRPIHTSGGMHEHNEGVERTCAAKSPEHVFRQVVDVDRTVVCTEILDVFPYLVYCSYRVHCNNETGNCYRLCYEEGVQI